MTTTTLNSLSPGEKAIISDVAAVPPSTQLRLLEMGLTRGTLVEIIRFAPFGDPIEIAVRGYRLSLRRSEAEAVSVTRTEP